MVLQCSCGWVGVDLVPNYDDDTARCPKCGNVFQGIPASNAWVAGMSDGEKEEIVRESKSLMGR